MPGKLVARNLSLTSKLGSRLIKFRYGPKALSSGGAQVEIKPAQGTSQPSQPSSTEAIWDFQLPARWRRAPISEDECAVINNGGPL